MKSNTAKKDVAIYSLVFGAIALLGTVTSEPNTPALILSLAIVVLGILLLVRFLAKIEQGLIITSLALYALFIVAGIIIFIDNKTLGLIAMFMFALPFAFAIVYLVLLSKERKRLFETQIAEAAAKLVTHQKDSAATKEESNE